MPKDRFVGLQAIWDNPAWQQDRVPNHVLVKYFDGVDEDAFAAVLNKHGAKIERDITMIRWRCLELEDPAKINDLVAELHTDGHIMNAEPNRINRNPSHGRLVR